MLPADLKRAAQILDREAKALRECHTIGGRWMLTVSEDHDAKAAHDEMRDLARKLRAAAKE